MNLYVIQGDPVSIQRSKSENIQKTYDARRNDKLLATISLGSQHDSKPLFEGPLSIDITFYMKIPQMRRKRGDTSTHDTKADFDKLIQFVLDAGNTVLYSHNGQIAKINAQKIYDANPRTEFRLIEIK